MKRRIFGVGLAAGAAQLAGTLPARAGKTAELPIGFISALSGPGMSWGVSMLGGLEMAADDVNAAGGIAIGDTQYRIKVIPYDDKYSGPPAAEAAQRLISQDGVNIIVGPLGSVSMLAIADITESSKVLVFSNSYTSKALNPEKPYTFRLTPTTAEFSEPFIAWIGRNKPELKTVAVISPNDESGKEVEAQSASAYQKTGIKLTTHEFFERNTQDFVPVLTRILATGPDMLDLDGATPVDSGVIVKQARQIGFKGPFVKVGGPGIADILRIAGDQADGLLYYSPWDAGDPKIAALVERFAAKHNKMAFNPLGIFFYDGAHMLFDAIAAAKTFASDGVKQQIEQQAGFNGALGRYVWGGQAAYGIRHQWIAPFYIGQIQQGKEVMIAKIDA